MKIVPHKAKITPITVSAEQRKEKKLLGTLRPKPGQKIWEVHVNALTITEAEYEKPDTIPYPLSKHAPPATLKGKLIVKPDCAYYCAINKKSVVKQHIKAYKAFQDKLKKLKDNG